MLSVVLRPADTHQHSLGCNLQVRSYDLLDCHCRGVEDLKDSCKACFDNIQRFHCLQTVRHALARSDALTEYSPKRVN